MDGREAERLVGSHLGCELIGRNGEGEMMDAEKAGERGDHCPYGRANRWGMGHGIV